MKTITPGGPQVFIGEISASDANPRREFDQAAMESLTESIRTHGVLQPIIVRLVDERLEVVCGHRRLQAARAAGAVMHSVACQIVPPWGAKKRGDFHFVAQVPFDEGLVKKLTALTHGMPLEIALENAEHELAIDDEQAAVVAFVAGT